MTMSTHSNGKRQADGSRQLEIGALWKKNTPIATLCYWSDIDPSTLRTCIDAVTRAGGAIMLGLTSDGGAYSICVLSGDDKIKEYPHGKLECNDMLRALTEYFT
jgi:hypothetical protein